MQVILTKIFESNWDSQAQLLANVCKITQTELICRKSIQNCEYFLKSTRVPAKLKTNVTRARIFELGNCSFLRRSRYYRYQADERLRNYVTQDSICWPSLYYLCK